MDGSRPDLPLHGQKSRRTKVIEPLQPQTGKPLDSSEHKGMTFVMVDRMPFAIHISPRCTCRKCVQDLERCRHVALELVGS